MTLTPLDILYLALAFAVLLVAIYASYTLYQLARTIREIQPLLEDIRDIADDIRSVKDGIKSSFTGLSSLIGSFITQKTTKKSKGE